MSSKKVFFVLLGLLVIVFGGAAAGTLYGAKALKKTGDKLMGLKLENAVLSKDRQSLVQAKKDIEKYSELEQVAKAIVPQEKDQVRTVREIVSLADQAGITLGNISFPESTLGEDSKAKKNSKASSAPAGATQLVPVEGLTGLYAMQISVDSEDETPVSYSALTEFLSLLEKNRRTSHVTSISIRPDDDNRNLLHFNLNINAYIKL